MTDRSSRMEQNRKEAEKFSDLAKAASSPFLRSYYWHIALRYLSSEGELNLAQDDSRTRILSEKAHSPFRVASRISPMSLAKAIEQRASQASLADCHALDALKRLYQELHPLCTPAENS